MLVVIVFVELKSLGCVAARGSVSLVQSRTIFKKLARIALRTYVIVIVNVMLVVASFC